MNDAGHDELSSVSSGINQMMDIIQASQVKLEKRVMERTTQLQNTNLQLEQEIVDRKMIEKELIINKEYLARLAHYDSLTAIPNRIFFNDQLNKAIQKSHSLNQELAIMFIDLDRFKNINDALGHHMGDLVLKKIAERLLSITNNQISLARLGGDEFIVLIQNCCEGSVHGCVKKILSELTRPICIESHEFFVSASIGIAVYPKDGKTLEELQQNADLAMYKAKRQGGANYQYFKDQMNLLAKANVQMEAALRKAISHQEFELYYQPKFCVKTGRIVGVESLIRWHHPEFGLILPSKFIPLAEETGLIMQIGAWVLHEACRINKSWIDSGFQPISIAVNLSAKQFNYQDITKLVASVLIETKLDPRYLELEITESAVMDNIHSVANKLNDIRKMGVKISVDDFGIGYTSLNYLKKFPVSVLKIDQNFIKGIPNNQNDISIISAVISLAHGLNMKVVAEGVENQDQLQWLANYNCDIVQGYFLSRPLPLEKIILLLKKNISISNDTVKNNQKDELLQK
jgi:diguanylate cyclase (GGDEF)-like protein